jgi:osmotically-inducible protein OsmY
MLAIATQTDVSEFLRSAVLAGLQSSGYHVLRNIECEVRDSAVFLSGVVPTFFLKQMAQAVALRVDQVREVVNRVEVTSTR